MKKYLILVLLLSLVGCQSGEIRDKNTLVIALTSEPAEGFDPCVGYGRYGSPLIQSTLIKFDADMEIEYDLATDFSISDDGLVWTFIIRDDAFLSNGEKITAKDVAFTYETAKNSGSVVDLSVLDHVNVIDDEKVEFHLKTPQITFMFTVAQTGIVPKEYYDENYYKEPIGSGAFTMLQWDKGQQVILGINEYYYGEKPNFEQVTILFMNYETAYLSAQKGLVDVAISNSNYAFLEIDGMTLRSFETIDNRGITLPVLANIGETTQDGYVIGNNVTADIAIRNALNYGINREQIIIDCLNGYGIEAFSECDGMPWGNDGIAVDYDFQKAVEILENAGWILNSNTKIREKDGETAKFTLLYTLDDEIRQALSYAVAIYAKELGILIDVEGTSWDDIDKRMFSCAVLFGWGSQNPLETYYLYHSSNMGVDYYNPENYSSERTDFNIEMAMNSTDYDISMEYFKKVQIDDFDGVSNENPWIWLVNIDHLYYVRDDLYLGEQKIQPHGHSWPLVGNLAEWKWEE